MLKKLLLGTFVNVPCLYLSLVYFYYKYNQVSDRTSEHIFIYSVLGTTVYWIFFAIYNSNENNKRDKLDAQKHRESVAQEIKSREAYIGRPTSTLIDNFGPTDSRQTDGKGGEIFIYTEASSTPNSRTYINKFFYADASGIIYKVEMGTKKESHIQPVHTTHVTVNNKITRSTW